MEQIDIFGEIYKPLPKWNGTLKLGTFFSGIGSPEKALKNIGIDYDLQFFSEIDKYAIDSYRAVHHELIEKWVGSITDLKGATLPYCDMWFGGFPCQDISLAGKGKGFSIESESRSSLGWEMIRLLREVDKKPKYVVFENVAAIFNETHRPVLNLFKQDLEELGYTLFDDLLNAKDYGIPQNRNRYFLVAILGEYNYKFPKGVKLKLKLKDMLEDEVDEKYYLSDKMVKYLTLENEKWTGNNGESLINKSIASCITTREGNTRADSSSYVCNELPNDYNLKILEDTKKGYREATDGDGIYLDRPHQKRGVVQKGMIPTLKTSGNDLGVVVNEPKVVGGLGEKKSNGGTQWYQQDRIHDDNVALSVTTVCNPYYQTNLRIRKLTPLECWRLMGFDDKDFNNAKIVGVSDSQLYKQAGNSIVVNVLEAIFKNLLGGQYAKDITT